MAHADLTCEINARGLCRLAAPSLLVSMGCAEGAQDTEFCHGARAGLTLCSIPRRAPQRAPEGVYEACHTRPSGRISSRAAPLGICSGWPLSLNRTSSNGSDLAALTCGLCKSCGRANPSTPTIRQPLSLSLSEGLWLRARSARLAIPLFLVRLGPKAPGRLGAQYK